MKLRSFRTQITEALKKVSVEKANNYNQKVNQKIQKPKLKQLLKREFNKKSMLTG
jgi:hypothetical protein